MVIPKRSTTLDTLHQFLAFDVGIDSYFFEIGLEQDFKAGSIYAGLAYHFSG
jgi:hypothetical protein